VNIVNIKPLTRLTTLVAALLISVIVSNPSFAAVTQTIEPASIGLGQAAQLTIAASGDEATAITPPMVAGLEFVAVGQSQQVESINGKTQSSTAIIYQVIPQRTGVFTIPGESAGEPPVVLTVNDGGATARGATAGGATAGGATSGGPATSSSAPGANSGGATHVAADSSAFVRLRLPKHDLYVGETIPVDIQVGTRDGVVASLNGLPTLNGDAFTLDKLSAQPQRTEEVVGGRPFTVFTWHSALAAVKPGNLSLTMETPLTVRIRSTPRPDNGFFGDSGLDAFFDDPTLQSFFGTSTEKDITVTSAPATFAVQALPVQGRPADFSGAVGHFSVTSDVSDDKAVAGDPLTLHLHVSGSGNFARVNSHMLQDVDHWKTYAPTATFKPEDEIGYRGEKTFDQPVIATQPGRQELPALAFSWFDPTTHRYAEARTSPLRIAVAPSGAPNGALANAPAPQGGAAAPGAAAPGASAPGATPAAAIVAANGADGARLRPDHADAGSHSESLTPHYFQAPYVAAPSALALAFLGLGLWLRRRDHAAVAAKAAGDLAASLQTAPLLQQMDQAASAGNAAIFFQAARQAIQRALAGRWHVPPAAITRGEADSRLGRDSEVIRLFDLADEANYSRVKLTNIDFKHWRQVVLRQINEESAT
jgi:hypothetical protein